VHLTADRRRLPCPVAVNDGKQSSDFWKGVPYMLDQDSRRFSRALSGSKFRSCVARFALHRTADAGSLASRKLPGFARVKLALLVSSRDGRPSPKSEGGFLFLPHGHTGLQEFLFAASAASARVSSPTARRPCSAAPSDDAGFSAQPLRSSTNPETAVIGRSDVSISFLLEEMSVFPEGA
jgi:hypothetical protein